MARGRVRGTDDGVGRWETDDDVEEYQMMMIRVVLVAFVGFVLIVLLIFGCDEPSSAFIFESAP